MRLPKEAADEIRARIQLLPLGAVQLAGAILAACPQVSPLLLDWMIEEMGRRVDMSEVSPAAEAAMKIYLFAQHDDSAMAQHELKSQYALLQAMHQEESLMNASVFSLRALKLIEEAILDIKGECV